MPEPTEGPTVLRILLGTQLRRLRESRGITAQASARALRHSLVIRKLWTTYSMARWAASA